MRFYDIIEKKKRGEELSREEILNSVRLYTEGALPDYQMSAFLMSIYFKGMTDSECAALTEAMLKSGDEIDLSALGRYTADKHSSGGVGDKLTLIVAPLAATLGCKVAKMSGRGLGHTGGTIDKLEAIPGFRCSLSKEDFLSQVERIGVAVVSQTANLAPADKKLYALRDATATVDSIPLIASSIMSKKLASGAKNITLDIKCGAGAFMKDEDSARELALTMVKIGKAHGRKVHAYITDMSFPLGRAVGNALEVKEAVEILLGRGDEDITELSVELSASMAACALGEDISVMRERARESLSSGKAFEKFLELVEAQGGNTDAVSDTSLLLSAPYTMEVKATVSGYAYSCDSEKIGTAAMLLGAGRATKESTIDPLAGVTLNIGRGSYVREGDTIATLHTSTEERLYEALPLVTSAYCFSSEKPKRKSVIIDEIRPKDC